MVVFMAETAEHRYVTSNGYIGIRDCFGIMGNPGATVPEHRLIATIMLGRRLESWEQVHHIDHNPKNNCPDNLVVVSSSEHGKLHKGRKVAPKKVVPPVHFNGNAEWVKLRCPECGKLFFKTKSSSYINHPNKIGSCNFCSRDCSSAFTHRVEERGYMTDAEQNAVNSCYICTFTTNGKFMREFLSGRHKHWEIDDFGEFHE
jgi:hypothetical protein